MRRVFAALAVACLLASPAAAADSNSAVKSCKGPECGAVTEVAVPEVYETEKFPHEPTVPAVSAGSLEDSVSSGMAHEISSQFQRESHEILAKAATPSAMGVGSYEEAAKETNFIARVEGTMATLDGLITQKSTLVQELREKAADLDQQVALYEALLKKYTAVKELGFYQDTKAVHQEEVENLQTHINAQKEEITEANQALHEIQHPQVNEELLGESHNLKKVQLVANIGQVDGSVAVADNTADKDETEQAAEAPSHHVADSEEVVKDVDGAVRKVHVSWDDEEQGERSSTAASFGTHTTGATGIKAEDLFGDFSGATGPADEEDEDEDEDDLSGASGFSGMTGFSGMSGATGIEDIISEIDAEAGQELGSKSAMHRRRTHRTSGRGEKRHLRKAHGARRH